MLNAVLDSETDKLMEYFHLIRNPKYRQLCGQSYRKESGRLAQGISLQVTVTNTIFFVFKVNVPANRWKDVTYGRIVVSYQLEKDDPYRTRITVVGD